MYVYEEFLNWYAQNEKMFAEYAEYICDQIKDILKQQYDVFLAYTASRAKSMDSLRAKCKKVLEVSETGDVKYKYNDPKNQITDLSGVRVVAYTVSDLEIIGYVIEKMFDVDSTNSVDKKKLLSTDKVGYLSIHYIVSLKETDSHYNVYKNMKCEIQVRTVLQDAWAQIFHDRQYKPSNSLKLPEDLSRETHLLSAALELIDNDIDLLAKKYDSYYKLPNKKEFNKFLDERISEKNLSRYIYVVFGKSCLCYDYVFLQKIFRHFEFKTIRDLDMIFDFKLVEILKSKTIITIDNIIIYMVIIKYPKEFFDEFRNDIYMTPESLSVLRKCVDNFDSYL